MGELLVLAPLRLEGLTARSARTSASVAVTGMGPARSRREAGRLRLEGRPERALAIVGFGGALDDRLQPGDLIVATEVRGPGGRVRSLPSSRVLAGELRRAGLPVVLGPIHTTDEVVHGASRRNLANGTSVAVDMESAWLLDRVSPGHPTAVVRAVVDTASRELYSWRTPSSALRAARHLRRAMPILERWAAATRPRRVVLASPRGFCAGVERAIEVVERALERYGPPVYVRRQIIHNRHVVADLTARGAVFVHELDEVPPGSCTVFAAHGVSPEVRDEAVGRGLATIDATCPLVAKVHAEVRRFASRGLHVVLIGHEDHEEVQGTLGEASDAITVVADVAAAREVAVPDPDRVAYVTQTTLAQGEVAEIIDELHARFPTIEGPPREDICYASQNRQDAAKALAAECDVVLVVGSGNSSNSNRLVEVVQREGGRAHLLDDDGDLRLDWIADAGTVGITAGASAPEAMVQRVVAALGALGPIEVTERTHAVEDVAFALPSEVR